MCSQNERSISKEKLLSPKAKVTLLISTIILMVLFVAMPVQSAHADSVTANGVRFTYTEKSDSVEITDIYCSTYRDIYVPGRINNKPVTKIDVSSRSIRSLDLSACSGLKELQCGDNQIGSIKLSGCSSLEKLGCVHNLMSSLDISGCPNLIELVCFDNYISTITFGNNTSLKDLDCSRNELTSLNISNCPNLETLDCSFNRITSLNIENNKKLSSLICSDNLIGNTSALEAWRKQAGHSGDILPQTGGHWVKGSKGWWYKYDVFAYGQNIYAKGWLKLGTTTYYFDNNGWMKTGWQKVNNNWYYFASSGAMKTGWQKVSGK